MGNGWGSEDSKNWLQFSSIQCSRGMMSLHARSFNKRLLIVKQALYLLGDIQTRMNIEHLLLRGLHTNRHLCNIVDNMKVEVRRAPWDTEEKQHN